MDFPETLYDKYEAQQRKNIPTKKNKYIIELIRKDLDYINSYIHEIKEKYKQDQDFYSEY